MSPARGLALAAVNMGLALSCTTAAAQRPDEQFSPVQIEKGAEIYARTCAPCHGPRMADPHGASNLRAFPRDQKDRFVVLVVKGRNNMPPLGDLLKPDDLDALWAYVVAGEQ